MNAQLDGPATQRSRRRMDTLPLLRGPGPVQRRAGPGALDFRSPAATSSAVGTVPAPFFRRASGSAESSREDHEALLLRPEVRHDGQRVGVGEVVVLALRGLQGHAVDRGQLHVGREGVHLRLPVAERIGTMIVDQRLAPGAGQPALVVVVPSIPTSGVNVSTPEARNPPREGRLPLAPPRRPTAWPLGV